MKVVVKIRYGDFWVNDLPSVAVDSCVLSRVHDAMMLAAFQRDMGIRTASGDEVLKDFPVVHVEWGKKVDYQSVIVIPMGDYYVEIDSDPKITKFVPTGSQRGVSFPVSVIPDRRAHRKMYSSPQIQKPQRRSTWDIITHAIELAFGDRVLIQKNEEGETSVVVTDRTSGRTIVWYRYAGERKLDQGGTCLSGSEQTLSPFAVVAAYYQMLETGRQVADGVAIFYP